MNNENVLRVAATLAQLSYKNLERYRATRNERTLKAAVWCDNGAQLLSRLALDNN